MTKSGNRASRSRAEDEQLVNGSAAFTDDLHRPNSVSMAIYRSPYGHARITDITVDDAVDTTDVVAVYTAADIDRSTASGTIPTMSNVFGSDDPDVPVRVRRSLSAPDRPILAHERVRYVGEPVAVILAEDRRTAHDAIDAIEVTFDRLPAETNPLEATENSARLVHDSVSNNLAFDWEIGDRTAVTDASSAADFTVELSIGHQQVSPVSLEPRAVLGEFDVTTGELTVHLGTQDPFGVRRTLATILRYPEEKIRVIAPEVGGGFGCKSKWYPAEALVAWCAIQTGRPVTWQATRRESFAADMNGRARTIDAELAFDADGTIQALWVDSHANLGAYLARGAPSTRTGSFVDSLSGQYQIPEIYCRVRGVFTNTSPVGSYRGSSRVQSILTIERLVDSAARRLRMDPATFRRQNFIPSHDFPYTTPTGHVYDSGEYASTLDRALELADYLTLRERQDSARGSTRPMGIGISCLVDNAGTPSAESARISVDVSGSVSVSCGTADQGQGHRTTFGQLVVDVLGVPFDDVEVSEGDTEGVPTGGGAVGSRSVVVAGEMVRRAAEDIVTQAGLVAAHVLEVSPDDLQFDAGVYSVAGTSAHTIHLQDLARLANEIGRLPDGRPATLEATASGSVPATYPFGTHVAVVTVDLSTGDVEIERYVAVDDCGVQLNPMLVEGQVVGGIGQGIGQGLFERVVYDDTGTLLTGSLQDYPLPRSVNTPDITVDHTVTPSPLNELGVKGTGESGAVGAPAAIGNAVVDALAPYGIEHLDLPITPESVWRAVPDEVIHDLG